MKIKDGYIVREIAGSFVVVPTGEQVVDFNGLMTINETAAFIWNVFKDGAEKSDVVKALTDEYDVDKETAAKDVDDIVKLLKSLDVFE